MEVTLSLISFDHRYYQNETWSCTTMLYDKHFKHGFGSMLDTEN